jgi:hypothetical protein
VNKSVKVQYGRIINECHVLVFFLNPWRSYNVLVRSLGACGRIGGIKYAHSIAVMLFVFL